MAATGPTQHGAPRDTADGAAAASSGTPPLPQHPLGRPWDATHGDGAPARPAVSAPGPAPSDSHRPASADGEPPERNGLTRTIPPLARAPLPVEDNRQTLIIETRDVARLAMEDRDAGRPAAEGRDAPRLPADTRQAGRGGDAAGAAYGEGRDLSPGAYEAGPYAPGRSTSLDPAPAQPLGAEQSAPHGRRPPSPLESGALIDGKYRVLRELGRGGMGIVYLAEDVALRRSVAVKVLLPRYARDLRHAERFRREARMLAAIEDENVVHIHALGNHDGLPYLVMDYVMGDTLATFLAGMQSAYEVIPLDLAFSLGRQLCRALSAVHAAGIVHRDVKPGNVMITAGPRAILMDFSLARDTHTAYSGNHMVGTPDYVAPEQIRGRLLTGAEGQRSDIYSLGVTLFETLTGQLPFRGSDSMSVLHCHLQQPPPRPSEVRPDLPAAFDPVLLRALAKDPADRWPSCDDLGEALTVAYRAARGTPRRRVLIAADAQGHAQALARMVGAWVPGTDVTTLSSGAALLSEVHRYAPALVLVDLSPGPREGGDPGPVEICAALRGDPTTARIPVVVLAASESAETMDRRFLRMLGARAVVNKPIDPVRLAALIRVVVAGDAASALT